MSLGGQHSTGSHSSSYPMLSSSHSSSQLSSNQSLATKLSQQMMKSEAIDDFDYPFCDDVSKYEKLTKIGQGLHLLTIDSYVD